MNFLSVSIQCEYRKKVCSRAKSYENDPQITLPQISAKCIIPDIKTLEDYGQGHMASLSTRMNLNDNDVSSYQIWTP